MAFPGTEEELRAFIVATMEAHGGAMPPMPLAQPPGMEQAREIVAQAEATMELLREREQAMRAHETEVKEAVAQASSLHEEISAKLEMAVQKMEENASKTAAELLRQDEATEASIASAQR